MPKMEYKSSAKPSLYAYPAPLEEKKAEEREKVATAVLSIAARQKRRETADKREDDKMDVDDDVKDALKEAKGEEKPKAEETAAASPASSKDDKKKASPKAGKDDAVASGSATADESKEAPKEKKEPEPNFEILQNPARVLRQQLKVVSLVDGQSYVPLKDITIGGIIVTQRQTKADDVEEVLVEPIAACGPKNEEVKEPDAPEPFEYIED